MLDCRCTEVQSCTTLEVSPITTRHYLIVLRLSEECVYKYEVAVQDLISLREILGKSLESFQYIDLYEFDDILEYLNSMYYGGI